MGPGGQSVCHGLRIAPVPKADAVVVARQPKVVPILLVGACRGQVGVELRPEPVAVQKRRIDRLRGEAFVKLLRTPAGAVFTGRRGLVARPECGGWSGRARKQCGP